MPIFEYVCQDCGAGFEQLVMGPEAAVSCPTCQSPDVAKQFSAFSTRTAAGFSGSMGAGCGCAPSG
jgi:putative FmdB family regulatory protein